MDASLGGLSAAKIVQNPTEQNSATAVTIRFVMVVHNNEWIRTPKA
jgi:hypothetical protein